MQISRKILVLPIILLLVALVWDIPQSYTQDMSTTVIAFNRLMTRDGQVVAENDRFSYEDDDLQRDIFILDIETGEESNLTQHPAGDWLSDWSPDGTRILFESTRAGNTDLFIMDADGRNIINITNTPDTDEGSAQWLSMDTVSYLVSAGSNVVGYREYWLTLSTGEISEPSSNLYNIQSNQYIVPTEDETYQLLDMITDQSLYEFEANNIYLLDAWSPDGRWLAYPHSFQHPRGDGLFVIDFDNREHIELFAERDYDLVGAAWSHDSQQLAFVGRDDNWYLNLFVVDVQSLEFRQLNPPDIVARNPQWSPDNQKIVFSCNASNICVVDIAAGVVEFLTSDGSDTKPLWQPIMNN